MASNDIFPLSGCPDVFPHTGITPRPFENHQSISNYQRARSSSDRWKI